MLKPLSRNANGVKERSLAKSLKNIKERIRLATTQHAILVASWIASSVETASNVDPKIHFLQMMQLARQMSANEDQNANRSLAAVHHVFIPKGK